MRETLNYVVFGWYPYLCLTVFLVGSLVRFDREQYTWRSGSSQLLRRQQLMWGSNLFHVGVLVIFLGHFGGLLTPIWIFEALAISHTFKQGMAIGIGGVAGVLAFIGLTLLVHRRLFDARIRNTSSFGDIAILLLLYVQLILGLSTIPISLQHMDGHVMVNFMTWAQGILTLQPGVYWLTYCGNTNTTLAVRAFAVGGLAAILGSDATLPTTPTVGWDVSRAYDSTNPATYPTGSPSRITAAPIAAVYVRLSA